MKNQGLIQGGWMGWFHESHGLVEILLENATVLYYIHAALQSF